jgi:hypothetical protein
MRKFVFIFAVFFFSISSWAQSTHDMSHDSSAGDVYLGYSLLNGDTFSHASGWEAALTGNLHDSPLGFKADFSGNYKSIAGVEGREYNVLFGPQLATGTERLRFFVHGLFGIAHASVDNGGPSSTGAAWVLGGGVDINLNHNFAFRPVQLDYHGSHVFSDTQRDARYSLGLVYRF